MIDIELNKTEEFVMSFIEKWGDDKYASLIIFKDTVYRGKKKDAVFHCKKHGKFVNTPSQLLKNGCCPRCLKIKRNIVLRKMENRKIIDPDFFEGWKERFWNKWRGNEYAERISMEKSVYKNALTPITFTCSKHGDFTSITSNIMRTGKCPKCHKELITMSRDEFIKRAREAHGDKYDYSKTVIRGTARMVTVTCPEHGDFEVLAGGHINPRLAKGKTYYTGCPKCAKRNKNTERRAQIIEREGRKEKIDMSLSGLSYIMDSLSKSLEYGIIALSNTDSSNSNKELVGKYMMQVTSAAIDMATERSPVDVKFMKEVSDLAMSYIIDLSSRFEYKFNNKSPIVKTLDRLKRPAWMLIDVCDMRMGNGNKNPFETRADASSLL